MLVGVPKEIKNHEYRVGLTPDSVHEVVAHGHEVVVETLRVLVLAQVTQTMKLLVQPFCRLLLTFLQRQK